MSESAYGRRICGLIEGLGWVNLARRSFVDDERAVWYIVPRLPPKGRKGGGSGKGGMCMALPQDVKLRILQYLAPRRMSKKHGETIVQQLSSTLDAERMIPIATRGLFISR